MRTNYAVVWREDEGPAQPGKLEIHDSALRLEGGGQAREVSFGELATMRVGRTPEDRLDGRPALVLEGRDGRTLRICTVGEVGALFELAERVADPRRSTMDTKGLLEVPLFTGMAPAVLEHIAYCGTEVRFHETEILFGEGDPADTFYVVRHGRVTIEMYVPERGMVTIETLGRGDVVGWSWLFPPYRWHFEARARSLVRATAFDAACLRAIGDADPAFGYDLMSRFAQILIDRLAGTQLRLLEAHRV